MFYFIARFLAKAKLKQAWLCSSGLTKTFLFMALFCWFYFTTILHFAAPLTAMKIPSAGASTWPVADVATS